MADEGEWAMSNVLATAATAVTCQTVYLTDVLQQAYEPLFWPAVVGHQSYAVYVVLKNLYTIMIDGAERIQSLGAVSVGSIERYSGVHRRAILGPVRATLEAHGLVRIYAVGTGRSTAYQYDIIRRLPILSPFQVEMLTKVLQVAHSAILGSCPGFDMPAWWNASDESFVPLCGGMVRLP